MKTRSQAALELLAELSLTADPMLSSRIEAINAMPDDEGFSEVGDGASSFTKSSGIAKMQNKYAAWMEVAVREIERIARQKPTFTSDDLRHLAPPVPNCMGAAFNKAVKQKLIKPVAFHMSTEGVAHGHYVRVWQLATS